ncbi:biotin carboxylase [Phytomonospora sp. NPDC050363]|uniref:ATP-grasp domain-containing protein n=1 Tax=Phytomonospora sp. NPDC050363 TaxID=3155642 RepID=UPI0033E612C8
MEARPHVVVIHRWLARYAEYERYIDHEANAVTYVTTEVAAPSLSTAAAAVELVAATDDLPSVADRVKHLVEDHGSPAAIVGLKEDDLLVAAQLRAEWDCPGPVLADLVPFRDKLVMAGKVAAAGVAVPAFAGVTDAGEVEAFAREHGYPVVVKPRVGSSSAGVSKLDGPAGLGDLDVDTHGPLMVQAFDERQIFHVDGLFDGTRTGPLRASRYLNTCLGFRTGDVLGSVEDPAVTGLVAEVTDRVLGALSPGRATPFHLELFVGEESGECAFLEVGARVGGAEIPFLWREVHGYDLMEAAFRLSMGLDPLPWDGFRAEETAGWLLVPAPAARPCRITEATPMTGRVPGPYAEALLSPGDVLPAADAYYEHVGGRFRFRGAGPAEVTAAIEATARDFRVRGEAP